MKGNNGENYEWKESKRNGRHIKPQSVNKKDRRNIIEIGKIKNKKKQSAKGKNEEGDSNSFEKNNGMV